jgi:hypothetical protein
MFKSHTPKAVASLIDNAIEGPQRDLPSTFILSSSTLSMNLTDSGCNSYIASGTCTFPIHAATIPKDIYSVLLGQRSDECISPT